MGTGMSGGLRNCSCGCRRGSNRARNLKMSDRRYPSRDKKCHFGDIVPSPNVVR